LLETWQFLKGCETACEFSRGFHHHRIGLLFIVEKHCEKMKFFIFLVLILVSLVSSQAPDTDVEEDSGLYTIEGKVYAPEIDNNYNWQDTQILLNSGEVKGFLKSDGTFIISKVPSGSYVVQVVNPNYFYEAVRIEINGKGKFRARKVNVSKLVYYKIDLIMMTTM
jgi:hypothetical protein